MQALRKDGWYATAANYWHVGPLCRRVTEKMSWIVRLAPAPLFNQ